MAYLTKIKTSPQQFEIMVDFFERNPKVLEGKLTAGMSKEKKERKWQELTELLNAERSGPRKETSLWKKTWKDYKCYTKKKALSIHATRTRNGRNPDFKEYLTPVEERVLNLFEPLTILKEEEADDSLISQEETEENCDSQNAPHSSQHRNIRTFYYSKDGVNKYAERNQRVNDISDDLHSVQDYNNAIQERIANTKEVRNIVQQDSFFLEKQQSEIQRLMHRRTINHTMRMQKLKFLSS